MFVYNNSRIPRLVSLFFPVAAITIGPFIFIGPGYDLGVRGRILLNHERIHVKQGAGLFFIGFWALYLLFWVSALLRTGNPKEAYMDIPFEREAYCNDYDLDYTPGFYTWVNYIFPPRDS